MAAPMKFGNWQEALDYLLQKSKDSGLLQGFKSLQSNADRIKFVFDNKILLDVEWLKLYFKECCPQFHKKSDEKSVHHRNLGNKFFQEKKYGQALAAYTQSVQFAPCGHGDSNHTDSLALAYGNRSAALFHMSKYQDCLLDTERAQNAGFPPQSLHKLHTRRCWSLLKLGLQTSASKELAVLRQLCDQAKQNGEKAAGSLSRDIQLIEKELLKLKEKESDAQSILNIDKHPVPQVSYRPNSVLVQASSAVEMKTSPTQGRFLQAKQPIKSGDTLIVEHPFAAVLLPDHYATHCHHCFVVLPSNPVGCLRCSRVLFCGEDCRDKAWDVYHHIECPYLDLLHSFLRNHHERRSTVPGLTKEGRYERNYLSVYDLMTHAEDMQTEDMFQYSLTAALLLTILVHSGWFSSGDEKQPEAQNPNSLMKDWKTKFERLETFLGTSSTKGEKSEKGDNSEEPPDQGAESVPTLAPHAGGDGDQQLTSVGSDRMNTRAAQGYVDNLHPCGDGVCSSTSRREVSANSVKTGVVDGSTWTDDVYSVGGVLLRHVQQLVCNAHAITALHATQTDEGSAVETQSQVRVATAIYPTASLMNHSCDPTIISSFIKDVLVVKSVKDVPIGGEIFNCYGPHWKRMRRSERQEILKTQYFFECCCEACTGIKDDFSLCESLKCQHCGNSMAVHQEVRVCPNCHRTCDMAVMLQQLETADKRFADGIEKLERGNHADALASLLSCLRIRQSVMADDHRELGQTHDALAQCLAVSGRYAEAADHLTSSLRVTESLYGADSVELTRELHKMAEVQVNAGRPREALRTATRALKCARMHCAESDNWVQELLCLETALTRIVADSDAALG
ncbi:hypothetical protein BaRGS_00036171 [Batillaria attramentaria]|uniref:Protein-lysine N-methyltransferase SMYD4 n=1 Tax=Batillaria attramentaria TaxID=370345 RepID=A0ABD0JCA7_9CAEN